MDNYVKGDVKVIEDEDQCPLPGLPSDFLWMKVRGGSKIRNLMGFAVSSFKEKRLILWSGSGAAVAKTVSCSELMKQKFRCYQATKIDYRRIEEMWEPTVEGLDTLKVVRNIPCIHILLSLDSIDETLPGYQAPDEKAKKGNSRANQNKKPRKPRVSKADLQASGLEFRKQDFKKRRGNKQDKPPPSKKTGKSAPEEKE